MPLKKKISGPSLSSEPGDESFQQIRMARESYQIVLIEGAYSSEIEPVFQRLRQEASSERCLEIRMEGELLRRSLFEIFRSTLKLKSASSRAQVLLELQSRFDTILIHRLDRFEDSSEFLLEAARALETTKLAASCIRFPELDSEIVFDVGLIRHEAISLREFSLWLERKRLQVEDEDLIREIHSWASGSFDVIRKLLAPLVTNPRTFSRNDFIQEAEKVEKSVWSQILSTMSEEAKALLTQQSLLTFESSFSELLRSELKKLLGSDFYVFQLFSKSPLGSGNSLKILISDCLQEEKKLFWRRELVQRLEKEDKDLASIKELVFQLTKLGKISEAVSRFETIQQKLRYDGDLSEFVRLTDSIFLELSQEAFENRAFALNLLGRSEQAIEEIEERSRVHPREELECLRAEILFEIDPTQAERLASDLLEKYAEPSVQKLKALFVKSFCLYSQEPELARPYLEEGLNLIRKLKFEDSRLVSNFHLTLAYLESAQARYEEALPHFQNALICVEKNKAPIRFLLNTKESYALNLYRLGRMSEAVVIFQEILEKAKGLGYRRGILYANQNLAEDEIARGDLDRAENRLLESFGKPLHDFTRDEITSLILLMCISIYRGDEVQALERLDLALSQKVMERRTQLRAFLESFRRLLTFQGSSQDFFRQMRKESQALSGSEKNSLLQLALILCFNRACFPSKEDLKGLDLDQSSYGLELSCRALFAFFQGLAGAAYDEDASRLPFRFRGQESEGRIWWLLVIVQRWMRAHHRKNLQESVEMKRIYEERAKSFPKNFQFLKVLDRVIRFSELPESDPFFDSLDSTGFFSNGSHSASQEADLLFEKKTSSIHFQGQDPLILKRPQSQKLFELLIVARQRGGDSEPLCVGKEELCLTLWGENYNPLVHDSRIYTAVRRLRKDLESLETESELIVEQSGQYAIDENFRVAMV